LKFPQKKNKYEYGFEEFIKATMVKDAWACEINIVSVTILLKTAKMGLQ